MAVYLWDLPVWTSSPADGLAACFMGFALPGREGLAAGQATVLIVSDVCYFLCHADDPTAYLSLLFVLMIYDLHLWDVLAQQLHCLATEGFKDSKFIGILI